MITDEQIKSLGWKQIDAMTFTFESEDKKTQLKLERSMANTGNFTLYHSQEGLQYPHLPIYKYHIYDLEKLARIMVTYADNTLWPDIPMKEEEKIVKIYLMTFDGKAHIATVEIKKKDIENTTPIIIYRNRAFRYHHSQSSDTEYRESKAIEFFFDETTNKDSYNVWRV